MGVCVVFLCDEEGVLDLQGRWAGRFCWKRAPDNSAQSRRGARRPPTPGSRCRTAAGMLWMGPAWARGGASAKWCHSTAGCLGRM